MKFAALTCFVFCGLMCKTVTALERLDIKSQESAPQSSITPTMFAFKSLVDSKINQIYEDKIHLIMHADENEHFDSSSQLIQKLPRSRNLQQHNQQVISHPQTQQTFAHSPQVDKNGRIIPSSLPPIRQQAVAIHPQQPQTPPPQQHQVQHPPKHLQAQQATTPLELKPVVHRAPESTQSQIPHVPSGPANSSVYSHLQHYFALNILPVVFINYGTQQEMMKYCIEVSSRLNPVIVLSDTFSEQQAMDMTLTSLSSSNQPVFYIAFNDFLNEELIAFNKIYRPFQLQRDNPKRQMYEKQCITRWLVLNQLAKLHRIPTLFYVDSDVAVFGNITTAYHIRHNHLRHCDVMMSAAGGQAPRGDNRIGTFAGHSSFWSAASLVDLSRFFFELYSPEFIEVLHYPNPPRDRQRISDMSLLYLLFVAHNRNVTHHLDTGATFGEYISCWYDGKKPNEQHAMSENVKRVYDDSFNRARDEFKIPNVSNPSLQVCNILDIYAQTTFDHMQYFLHQNFTLNLDGIVFENSTRPVHYPLSGIVDPLSVFLPFIVSKHHMNGFGGWTEMFSEDIIERFDRVDQARLVMEKMKSETGVDGVLRLLNVTETTANLKVSNSSNNSARRLQADTNTTQSTSALSVQPFVAPDDRIYFYSGHYQGPSKHYIQFDICRRLVSVSQFQMERAALSVQYQALHAKHHHKHHPDVTNVTATPRLRRRRLEDAAQNTSSHYKLQLTIANITTARTHTLPVHSHESHEHSHRQQRISADHTAFEALAHLIVATQDLTARAKLVYDFMLHRIVDGTVQNRCREIFDKKEVFPKYTTRRLSREMDGISESEDRVEEQRREWNNRMNDMY